jgi:hypothetical protein
VKKFGALLIVLGLIDIEVVLWVSFHFNMSWSSSQCGMMSLQGVLGLVACFIGTALINWD